MSARAALLIGVVVFGPGMLPGCGRMAAYPRFGDPDGGESDATGLIADVAAPMFDGLGGSSGSSGRTGGAGGNAPQSTCDLLLTTLCPGGQWCVGGVASNLSTLHLPCPAPGSPSQTCLVGTPYMCTSRRCAEPAERDRRYDEPFCSQNGPLPPSRLRLLCAEGRPHRMGDNCKTDDECRPAAAGIQALRCDASTLRCVLASRPAAPRGYGEPCGRRPSGGAACPVCLSATDDSGCLREACSMPCWYDDDCPDGSICLCDQICAEAKERRPDLRRLPWLKCAPVTDAGADTPTTRD